MKKLKVVTVIGTRPEIIRLSRVMSLLDEFCNHIIVHTGQNYDYELNQIFFDDLELRKPNYFLDCANASLSTMQTISNLITSIDAVLELEQPDALLVLGDTNSCLSVIPAKRRKIPIFHMEAGNRCFDLRVPEEINRKIVDHTSDVNLPYSDIAREYLLKEGLSPDLVIKTGSPMNEVIMYNKNKIEKSDILKKLDLINGEYFVFSAHREENVDSPYMLEKLVNIINSVATLYKNKVIVSVHPRTNKRLIESGLKFNELVKLLKPMGFHDYLKLQACSRAVLSDSGTISEEASILKFPALNLRETHERPEAMEEATVIMVGLELERVHQALRIIDKNRQNAFNSLTVQDYNVQNVSFKILKIIHSYTDYVNKFIWHKQKK